MWSTPAGDPPARLVSVNVVEPPRSDMVAPIGVKAPPPAPYPQGSWGPAEAGQLLLRDGRSWVLETVTEKSAAEGGISEEQADHQVRRRGNRG